MRKLKRIEKGHYYLENIGNECINGCSDWTCLFAYRLDDGRWGVCLDGVMTFRIFESLKEVRETY